MKKLRLFSRNIISVFEILNIIIKFAKILKTDMYWTLELASKLEDAPWPATRNELLEWAIRSGVPNEVIENLKEIEDEGDVYVQ